MVRLIPYFLHLFVKRKQKTHLRPFTVLFTETCPKRGYSLVSVLVNTFWQRVVLCDFRISRYLPTCGNKSNISIIITSERNKKIGSSTIPIPTTKLKIQTLLVIITTMFRNSKSAPCVAWDSNISLLHSIFPIPTTGKERRVLPILAA